MTDSAQIIVKKHTFKFGHICPHYSSQADGTIGDSTLSNYSKGGTLVVPVDFCYGRKSRSLNFALWRGVNLSFAHFGSQEIQAKVSLIVSGWHFGCVVVVGSPYSS